MDTVTDAAGSKNQFVFVVCGAKEHIETLHYALRALKPRTRNAIVVLTDTARNEIAIEWPHIVDMRTPAHFDHHQASIYLKTGIHRFVPSGPRYCYLDTDVIAVDVDVDAVFDHKRGVITFAADQVRVHEFSRYAIRCACESDKQQAVAELATIKSWVYDNVPDIVPSQLILTEPGVYQQRRADPTTVLRVFLRFLRANRSGSNGHAPPLERWKRYWFEAQDTKFYFEPDKLVREVQQRSAWRYDWGRKAWISPAGQDIYQTYCHHLVEAIERKFGILVADPYWQHWNGGVFLFESDSHAFLEAWHNKTMQIFEDPEWFTRDQGTLIATVWEFGLQSASVLPPRFNVIVDYYNHALMMDDAETFITRDAFLTREQPVFVHVFYRFGDTDWHVWNWVKARVEQKQC